MSQPEDPQRPSFAFGNPFRMMLPKNTHLSPRLLALLNNFEESLAKRLRNLKPRDMEEVLGLSWMTRAIEALCATHTDIITLTAALELPVCDWDDKWIDVYLGNSIKLLDICVALSSELSRLNQGNLYLQCALQNLDCPSQDIAKGRSTLDGWSKHINSKNPRLENCFLILNSLTETLDLPKVKKSAKGKVLMRAMYGLRVATVFICRIFAVGLSGSAMKLLELQTPETVLWAHAFADIQGFINGEMRKIYDSGRVSALKELEAVGISVKAFFPVTRNGADMIEPEALRLLVTDLRNRADKLSGGLDLLVKEVDRFFRIVLTGRNALLGNLRIGSDVVNLTKETNNVKSQVVR